MDKPAVWVGVEVSKEQLEAVLRPSSEQCSLPNDECALRKLVKRSFPLRRARIVVEATGGYETVGVAVLQAAGLPSAGQSTLDACSPKVSDSWKTDALNRVEPRGEFQWRHRENPGRSHHQRLPPSRLGKSTPETGSD